MPTGWTDKIDWHAIHATREALPKGERGPYIDGVADSLGRSSDTIYRQLRERFGRCKDVTRAPRVYSDDVVREIAVHKEIYARMLLKGSDRELSTEVVLDLMQQEGKLPEGVSVSGANTALRRVGYRDLDPRTRVEASYTGQRFLLDFSRSKHFQVVKPLPGGDWLLRVHAKELHYKDGAVRLRTWVVQMIDDYSRLRLVRYFAATSESAVLGIHFLGWALGRDEDEHAMRHVPEGLTGDNGSFLKSPEGRSVMKALGVHARRSAPGNSEANGKVERGFSSLWQRFESVVAHRLLLEQGDGASFTLDRLNRAVHAFTCAEHSAPHPWRAGATRGGLYQASLLERPLGVLAHDLRDLALRTYERTADATRVLSIEGARFEVPPFAAGHVVRAYRSMSGDWVGELVDGYHAGRPFALRPFSPADLLVFEGRPSRSYAQETRGYAAEQQRRTRALHMQSAAPVPVASPILDVRASAALPPPRLSRLEALAALGERLAGADIDPRSLDLTALVPERGLTPAEVTALGARLADLAAPVSAS